MRGERRLEALRRHDLDDVAGRDVFLGRGNHRHVTLARDVRGDRRVVDGDAAGAFEKRRHGGTLEALDYLVDLNPRVLIRHLGRGEFFDRHVGDNFERLADVVEAQHRVGEHQVEIGRAEIVDGGLGNLLEASHDVVGEKADRAAEEARQVGQLGRAEAFDLGAQLLE